jgi:hypothetical protein
MVAEMAGENPRRKVVETTGREAYDDIDGLVLV